MGEVPVSRSTRIRVALLVALAVIALAVAYGRRIAVRGWWLTPPVPERRLAADVVGPGPHAHTNQLIDETSPYLLQHVHDPVHWYPWGDEALALAKAEDKPIFLSVGYSTNYWCRVMAAECFADDEVAALLNTHVIAIKVDREERPDIDEQYMLATQLVTERSGWPASVWLTPDGKPWTAGSYYPKARFMATLTTLARAWTERREDVEAQADMLAEAIAEVGAQGFQADGDGTIDAALVARAVESAVASYDAAHGGFGGAPMFPPHGTLWLLATEHRRTGDPQLAAILRGTLDAMWRGGLHDHLGGGFHRYSRDRQWLLPQYEKTLYDNAQLMHAYTQGYRLSGEARYRDAVRDIYTWLTRDMQDPGGAFYAALGSGDVGEEGAIYLWHLPEVREVLGEADGAAFAALYNLKTRGNVRDEATGQLSGANIPHLTAPIPATQATAAAAWRAKLLARRQTWAQPHRDDKILTSWNALMIGSLAAAGQYLQEPAYTEAAARAATFVLAELVDAEGRLLHSYCAGTAQIPGYLDDYAYLSWALLQLYDATDDAVWLGHAERLAAQMLALFEDPEAGGFFFTSDRHEALLMRSKTLTGGVNVPEANGVAVLVLDRLHALTGEARYRTAADRTLTGFAALVRHNPRAMPTVVVAAAARLQATAP